MNTTNLSNFIVIKAFSENNRNLLDCIMPFVEYGIAAFNQEYIMVSDLKAYIQRECLLDIPIATLQTLLKRLKKDNKLTDYEQWTRIRRVDNYSQSSQNYEVAVHNSSRDVNKLILDCRAYCKYSLDDEEMSKLIYDFFQAYQHHIDLQSGTTELRKDISNEKYIALASYIDHISAYDSENYATICNLFFGFILGQYIKGNEDLNRKKSGSCTIYIDTDYLLRILDMQAVHFTKASTELLQLMNRFGFSVEVLPEVLDETRNVLGAALNRYIHEGDNLKHLHGDRVTELSGILGAFFRRSMTPNQVMDYIANLEKELAKLPIRVLSSGIPAHITGNPSELQGIIEAKEKIHHIDTIQKINEKTAAEKRIREKSELDAKLLAYIRHRRAKRVYRFQDVRYLLLSCDNAIYRVNKRSHSNASIAECMNEDALTNILFLCDPSLNSDVPIKLLVSIFQSSKYIDHSVLNHFHGAVTDYLRENPNDQQYLAEVFKNQKLFSELNGYYTFGEPSDTVESEMIRHLFDAAKDASDGKNEELAALADENKRLRQELETIKNETDQPFCPDEAPVPTTAEPENLVNSSAERLFKSFRMFALLTFDAVWIAAAFIGWPRFFPTQQLLIRISCLLPFAAFLTVLNEELLQEETTARLIQRYVYGDKTSSAWEILLPVILKVAKFTFLSVIIPLLVAFAKLAA